MNKSNLYSLVLFLLGLGFLAGTQANLQSLAFSVVCFIFLSFPLISSIVARLMIKTKPNQTGNDEIVLGVGA
jgi:hypothetical protein